jgi:hypothetical protein
LINRGWDSFISADIEFHSTASQPKQFRGQATVNAGALGFSERRLLHDIQRR